MKLSTLLIKYILHKGVECKQTNICVISENIDRYCTDIAFSLNNATIVTGHAEKVTGKICHIASFNFKGKRYKDCLLDGGVNSITVGERTNFLVIETLGENELPLILYHEPA